MNTSMSRDHFRDRILAIKYQSIFRSIKANRIDKFVIGIMTATALTRISKAYIKFFSNIFNKKKNKSCINNMANILRKM